jgi:diacylglycerol kinase (ATP)
VSGAKQPLAILRGVSSSTESGSYQAQPHTSPVTGAPYRNALVIANPISGRGQAAKAATELRDGLRSLGVAAELYLTSGRGDAFSHLRTLGNSLDLVVSVGGDGTLREVLEGLVEPQTPVSMLPFGTANVLAKELSLPRDVSHHLEILMRHRVVNVDVANVNGKLSLLMTGVGFDAHVVREVESRRQGSITKWAYVSASLRALRSYKAPSLQVTLDGVPLKSKVGFVLISNTMNYGGVMQLAQDTRMDDGEFEVYLFPTGGLFEIARAFVRGVVSHLPGGPVSMQRAKEIIVTSDSPVPVQIDGDLGGETPVEIRIAPNRYRLVVP